MNNRQRTWAIVGLGTAVVLIGGGVAAVLLLPLDGSSSATGTQLTGTIEQGAVTRSVSATGTLAPVSETAVGFTVGGTIATVNVTPGQIVKVGDTLATLDPSSLQRTLTVAQSALTADQTALADAETALASVQASASASASATSTSGTTTTTSATSGSGRATASGSSGSGSSAPSGTSTNSAQSIAQAQSTVLSDEQKVTSDETTVANAQDAVTASTLTAPATGEVVAVGGSVGQIVSGSGTSAVTAGSAGATSSGSGGGGTGGGNGGGSSVVTIADTAQDTVTTEVPESEVAALTVGQSATVTFPAATGQSATAKVTAIAPVGTSSNGLVEFPVTVTLSGVPSGVRYGETADVSVVTQSSSASALYVPAAAIHTANGSAYIEVVGSSGSIKDVTVTTGVVGDDGTQISGSGITAGETISLGTVAATTTGTGSSGSTGFGGRGLGGGGGGFGGGGAGFGGGGRGGGSGSGSRNSGTGSGSGAGSGSGTGSAG